MLSECRFYKKSCYNNVKTKNLFLGSFANTHPGLININQEPTLQLFCQEHQRGKKKKRFCQIGSIININWQLSGDPAQAGQASIDLINFKQIGLRLVKQQQHKNLFVKFFRVKRWRNDSFKSKKCIEIVFFEKSNGFILTNSSWK